MALCRYCGRYNDITEWPGDLQEAYVQHCCYKCFLENPDRINIEEAKDEAEQLEADEPLDESEDDGFDEECEPDDVIDPTDDDDSTE